MTFISSPSHSLTLGAVDLLGDPVAAGWWIEALGDAHDMGNPVPVEKEIASFMQDGTIKTIESYGNREMTLSLRIRATSSAFLAAAESALMAEVGQRNVLTWVPPDNTGAFAGLPCVFDVVTSHLDFIFGDINELQLLRVYKLTITASPWVRAQERLTVTLPAPVAGTPTVTTVDDCTATTGWARTTTGTSTAAGPTVVGGAVTASMTNNTTTYWQAVSVTLTRSGLSASMTTTPYVRMDFTAGAGGGAQGYANAVSVTVKINGTTVNPVATNGTVRWYAMPGGATTLTSVAITASGTVSKSGGNASVTVNDISRSNASTDIVGQKQTYSALNIAGSVRTDGSIALADATPSALGSTLVYTVPNPGTLAQPNLRARRTDTPNPTYTAETVDASAVSGKTSHLNSVYQHIFSIPVSQVPAGGYSLMARVQNPVAGSYYIFSSAASRMGSTVIGTTPGPASPSFALDAGTWTIVDLGHFVLPVDQLGDNGFVDLRIWSDIGVASIVLDEAWLFNTDLGQLTWIETGTATPASGGSSNRVWLDAASLDSPVPTVWQGTASDRSDQYHAGRSAYSFGRHRLEPPLTNIFVVTTNAAATSVTANYYPRFHSHVT